MFDASLLQSLKENVTKVRPIGFGITAQEYADEIGVSFKTGQAHLNAVEKRGELISEYMKHGSVISKVYYRPG